MKKDSVALSIQALFTEHSTPLSVPQIQDFLAKKKITPNKTTLYRALKKLEETSEIEEVLLDSSVTFYERPTHHHHHFTCNDCASITCVDDSELESKIHQMEKKLAQKGFQITNHQFSLSGTCTNCI